MLVGCPLTDAPERYAKVQVKDAVWDRTDYSVVWYPVQSEKDRADACDASAIDRRIQEARVEAATKKAEIRAAREADRALHPGRGRGRPPLGRGIEGTPDLFD